MRPFKRIEVLWAYGAQALNIGAGLLLLPVILSTLPPADVGVWFVFITLGGLAQLLELGFQPTIARNTTYILAGAQSLQKEGLPSKIESACEVDVGLLAKLISSSRRIYRWVALLSAVSLLGGGSVYVYHVLSESQDKLTTLIAWNLFALGHILTFYFGYISAVLQGRGDISQASKVIILSRGVLIVLGTLSLTLNFGLLGLGFASLLSAALGRIAAIRYLRLEPSTNAAIALSRSDSGGELASLMWHNAKKMAAVQLSAFVIQRANILIGTSFLGPAAVASYSMTLTILMALSSVSSVICQIQLPRISALHLKNDNKQIRRVYLQLNLVSVCLFLFGFLAVGLVGGPLLQFIGSQVDPLPARIYYIFGAIILLEMHHSIAATYITTLNAIPFVRSAALSALLTFALTLSLIGPFGVLGLVIAQGLSQLLYNNWKWPLIAYQHVLREK